MERYLQGMLWGGFLGFGAGGLFVMKATTGDGWLALVPLVTFGLLGWAQYAYDRRKRGVAA